MKSTQGDRRELIRSLHCPARKLLEEKEREKKRRTMGQGEEGCKKGWKKRQKKERKEGERKECEES